MNERFYTLPRAIVAGVWGTVLFFVGGDIFEGIVAILFGVPLLGLPWLLFLVHDRNEILRFAGIGAALLMLVGGAFISLLCALPIIVLIRLID